LNKHFKAEVISKISFFEKYIIIKLKPLVNVLSPVAGQFYLIKVNTTFDPLLRRPLSIFKYENDCIEFFFKIKGKGTRLLSEVKIGEKIDLFGPLGKGWELPNKNFKVIIVVGGIGIASVYLLLKNISQEIFMFYGAKSKNELLLHEEIKKFNNVKYIFCTEDGSVGYKGRIPDILDDYLSQDKTKDKVLYVCGPEGMIEAVIRIMKKYSLKGFLSLEERMACGIGACLGCVKKTAKGMKRVCKEGPVFSINQLLYS